MPHCADFAPVLNEKCAALTVLRQATGSQSPLIATSRTAIATVEQQI